jgi:hypothetical protein
VEVGVAEGRLLFLLLFLLLLLLFVLWLLLLLLFGGPGVGFAGVRRDMHRIGSWEG